MAKTNFDVINVPIKGSNLIEASAGTGKTYSVAILVIRMLIEKKIELKEILMVTFTKAAVAELEVRIRKFIREAYAYISHGAEIDKTIKTIVDNSIATIGSDEVLSLLNKARRQLDETSIFTIHGYCQKTLNEFAFETGQAFNSDVLEDQATFINEATNEYWRKHISTLDSELLVFLIKNGLSKSALTNVVATAMRGKEFIYPTHLNFEESQLELYKLISPLQCAEKEYDEKYQEALITFKEISESVKVYKYITDNIGDKNKFKTVLTKPFTKNHLNECSEAGCALVEIESDIKDKTINLINYLYGEAIPFCKANIQKRKQEQSLFSFDDLINKLHNTISSEALQIAMRQQYKAVFIDEFQDTDQKQYEIFDTFFNGHSILFYIGDPKQSIYSFKGTDIDTYLEASQHTDHAYTMSHNYRSTAAYIESMNTLFSSVEDPFFDKRIDYEIVKAGKSLPEIKRSNAVVSPLMAYKCKNLDEVCAQAVYQVKELLMGDYQIDGRKVKPSDIGILVRANAKGKDIKHALNKYNIPAITIDDSRVLESNQSTLLLYLLKAIFEPKTTTINRVLLSHLSPKAKYDLLNFDIERDIEFFKELHKMWIEKGVFSAINAFMDKYNTISHIQASIPNDAERITSNILQINEILHNKENQSKSSPKDLIHWLETAIAGGEESGDYTQRLENDEDAVKIVTIHKSKGLAYNIVIAPYLDLKSEYSSKWTFIEYKDPEKNHYCFASKITKDAKILYAQQAERENRRLIYVALTRAVYMGVIIHMPKDKCGINTFINAAIEKQVLSYQPSLEIDNHRYNETKVDIDKTPKSVSSSLINSTWNNYSFSMLSQYTPHQIPEAKALNEAYDKFIFETFPKGAIAGNFMHYLFENIDFTSQDFTGGIAKGLMRYKSVFANVDDKLETGISSMLTHVLQANIPTKNPFTLSEIGMNNKLPEVAFDFKMKGFNTQQLQTLIPHINLAREGNIQGMMSGFIDLLFEHQGQFYILDWKSNYLGNTTENYTQDKLEAAMQESNYHLQYYIYTIATKLYLENCMPGFDYEKHFGGVIYVYARGCRQGGRSGIYFSKPDVGVIDDLETLITN